MSKILAIEHESELLKRDQQIAELLERLKVLEEENERLKNLLTTKGKSKGSKKPKFKINYSVDKTQRKSKRGKTATGRHKKEQKSSQVDEREAIYPEGVKKGDCIVHRQQYVWRIIDGQAKYLCYDVYAKPGSLNLPLVPGTRNSRSEYGLEIILSVAFLHYWTGVSQDNACNILKYFTGLELTKSQANSLLNQLSTDWVKEYENIADLLALQLVVYIDETGWKVGGKDCYTWAFSTIEHVLFRCGVSRGKAEAEEILGEKFWGIGVSDNYNAYNNLFSDHQLCWAHLLRKSIKLMLENPQEENYREFFKELMNIYKEAVRCQKDKRLSEGRAEKAEKLQERIINLCIRAKEKIDEEKMTRYEATFIKLQNELVKGIDALFTFVLYPEVEPTNNRSERNVRREAEVRKGGRTSKSEKGAERRSIIMTVLATLNIRFEKFTLENFVKEVKSWIYAGRSIFQEELAEIAKANGLPVVQFIS
jgi:transposase